MNNIQPDQLARVPPVWGKPSKPIESGSIKGEVGLEQKVRALVGEFDDPRFNIPIKVIQEAPQRSGFSGWFKSLKKNFSFEYVNIRIPPLQEKPAYTIAIKVSDLTDKLFLSKEAIKAAHNKHQLLNLIDCIKKKYEEVIQNFKEKQHGELFLEKSGESTGLTAQELMKTITTALTTRINPQGTIIRLGQKQVVAFEKGGKLRFVSLQKRIKLGEGSNGIASTVLNLSKGTWKVLKTPLKNVVGAKKNIKREYNNLTRLHSLSNVGEPLRGIQKLPHAFYKITGIFSDEVGFIGTKYDYDMSDFMIDMEKKGKTLTQEQKMDACHQILSGLLHMKNLGLKHGDIKPNNIFIKEKNGNYLFHHADFGGARFYSDMKELAIGSFTEYCLPLNDLNEMQRCIKENNKPQFKIVSDSTDLFATAVCLYYLLTNGKLPFEEGYMDKREFANIQGGLDDKSLLESGCKPDLIDLLRNAMLPNPLDRISPQNALNKLNEIIKKEYPKLGEKLGLVKKTGEEIEIKNLSDIIDLSEIGGLIVEEKEE